ncbi:MAG: hypothetical protein OQK12_18480, partial [Motiliproteus sp.]|nr:hypothetical protein [Motiliproteus sp.]
PWLVFFDSNLPRFFRRYGWRYCGYRLPLLCVRVCDGLGVATGWLHVPGHWQAAQPTWQQHSWSRQSWLLGHCNRHFVGSDLVDFIPVVGGDQPGAGGEV